MFDLILRLRNIAGTPALCHCAGMGGADDKPVWERIADLGFADTVESKGFKRVGKTHWRLDGDGIVHHVKLYRGFSVQPGSFRDFGGSHVPGLDSMCRAVDVSSRSHRIPYSTARCHFLGNIHDAHVSREWQRFRREYPEGGGMAPNFRFEFLQPLRFFEPRVTEDNDSGAWIARDHEIGDVARFVAESWMQLEADRYDNDVDYLAFYARAVRGMLLSLGRPIPIHFIMARLAADHACIETMWGRVLADRKDSAENEMARLKSARSRIVAPTNWQELLKTPAGLERLEREAVRSVFEPLQRARQIRDHSRILGYGLNTDHLDLDALEAAERDPKWGPWLDD